MYTSPSEHKANSSLRDIYHPLFEKYGVDMVISGDNHNYQRTFPLKYNSISSNDNDNDNGVSDSSKPIISNNHKNEYGVDDGVIYLIAGTAGRGLYDLKGQMSFVVKQDDKHLGFLNLELKDKTLKGTFYANPSLTQFVSTEKNNHGNNKILDEFSISSQIDISKENNNDNSNDILYDFWNFL